MAILVESEEDIAAFADWTGSAPVVESAPAEVQAAPSTPAA